MDTTKTKKELGRRLAVSAIALILIGALLSLGHLPGRVLAQGAKTQTFEVVLGEGEVIGEESEKIIGEFHRWEPPVLVVRKGETVVITAKNPRKHFHTLSIPAFGVTSGLLEPRKGEQTLRFVADKAGVFPYVCGLEWGGPGSPTCDPDHKRMVGHLIVLE